MLERAERLGNKGKIAALGVLLEVGRRKAFVARVNARRRDSEDSRVGI